MSAVHHRGTAGLALAFALAGVLAMHAPAATGQGEDWRAALEAEKGKNARRISAIDEEGEKVTKQLRAVLQERAVHDANAPSRPSQAEAQAYNEEAADIDRRVNALSGRRDSLMAEQGRLRQRNAEIDRKLHPRLQLPVPCRSGSDCNVSGCCGNFDGNRGSGICQPSC